MKKNYNSARPKLHLPEYGRHIQEMVETLCTIEDRAERNKQARAVIAVMGNVNPLLRDTPVFTHKLWDHLFIISDFKLDVDSPYAQPSREDLAVRPRPMRYPQCRISHKHYGKYIGRIVKKISSEEPAKVATTIDNIAIFMRAKSFEYNLEHPNNEAIIKDIRMMSNGVIQIDEDAINNIQSDYKQHLSAHPTKAQHRSNNRNGFKNRSGHSGGHNGGHAGGHNGGYSGNRFNKNGAARRNQPK
ncbi:MAG: DUF4290 domain-containing protein [Rikenellaceae bacterium]